MAANPIPAATVLKNISVDAYDPDHVIAWADIRVISGGDDDHKNR
jgi:hypothetical protein